MENLTVKYRICRCYITNYGIVKSPMCRYIENGEEFQSILKKYEKYLSVSYEEFVKTYNRLGYAYCIEYIRE